LVDDDEENVSASVEIVAKQIIRECRELKNDERYQTRFNLDEVNESCSPTLLSLLKLISTSLRSSLSGVLIGNIVNNSITHHATTLQVALILILREKCLLSQLHKFGDANISSANGLDL